MTEQEIKKDEKKVCKCGELGRFFTHVAAVFLGALLAILVSAALLRPQTPPCHKPMPMQRFGVERQMPPMGHFDRGDGHQRGQKQIMHKRFNPDNVQQRPDFQPPARPEKAPANK